MDYEEEPVWEPDKIIDGLAEEQEVFNLNEIQLAEKMLRENLPVCVDSVVWLSRNSRNEKLRFDAARYVIERVLGKVNDQGLTKKGDIYDDFLEDVVTEYTEEPEQVDANDGE